MSAGSEGELALHERMAAASGGAALTALAVTPLMSSRRAWLAAEAPRGVGADGDVPSCGVFVLNNGLMEHVLEKKECQRLPAGGGWRPRRRRCGRYARGARARACGACMRAWVLH